MNYGIVCAPSGTGLKVAAQGLKKALGHNVAHEDVEYILCESKALMKAFGALEISKPPDRERWPEMGDVTWDLPRDQVVDLWRSALGDGLYKLYRNKKSSHKFLSCHLILYGGRRDEFYSPINVDSCTKIEGVKEEVKPSHVIVLIDDIYDMYLRLTSKDHLFDMGARVEQYLQETWNDEGNQGLQRFPQDLHSSLHLEWQLGTLTRLLSWRHAEILMAEALARQFDAEFLLWGIKQPTEIVASWLKGMASTSVYLSHPISRPRRQKRAQPDDWPRVVYEFNELQNQLFKHKLLCIMPTAIDEYRVAQKSRNYINDRLTLLEERWPLSTDDISSLLYTLPPDSGDMHHKELLAPLGKKTAMDSNVQLRALENQIKFQVSARDHLLVSSTKGLLVFRPLYLQGEFSDGVKAEIHHWSTLAGSENKLSDGKSKKRRAVFIHFNDDIRSFLRYARSRKAKMRGVDLNGSVDNEICRIISIKTGRRLESARNIFYAIKSKKLTTMLDKNEYRTANEIKDYLPVSEGEARINALREYLTLAGTLVSDSQVGIWVVENIEELRTCYPNISSFFLDTTCPPPNEWKHKVNSLLDQTRVGI